MSTYTDETNPEILQIHFPWIWVINHSDCESPSLACIKQYHIPQEIWLGIHV